MAIYRAPRPQNHFTQIRNDVLRDERLSYRARGLLAVVLSMPDDWNTTTEALARAGTEGRDAVRTAFTELEEAGYVRRVKRRDGRGRITTQVVVYDTPEEARLADQQAQGTLFDPPAPENPVPVPATGNQASVHQASVSQASIEHHQEHHSAPTERADPPGDVARALHDHTNGAARFIQIRQAAAKALKNGHTVEAVTQAMIELVDAGKPVTDLLLWQTLTGRQGGTMRNANTDHYRSGGGFSSKGGTP